MSTRTPTLTDRAAGWLDALRGAPTGQAPAGAAPPSQSDSEPHASGGVRGLETEYGIAAEGWSADQAAREVFKPVVAWGRSTNVFTPSGARLYLDVGAHPEYATAECSTLAELLAQDRAGDAVMWELAKAGAERAGRPVALFKNNVDSTGNAFGSHENYQIARQGAAEVAAALIPFLVTRQLVAGAGHVKLDPAGARYVLSGRADHIGEALSSATTRSRPMINTRDEPHADGRRWRRLHVIVGDSNMAQAATRWKVGATALVLEAAARGGALPKLELANPVAAIREVSHGWREAHPIALADGRTIRPASIQRAYLEVARTAAWTAEEAAVIGLWEKAVDAWDTGDFDSLERDLDWLAKLQLIERYRQRSGASLADPRVTRLELAYHQLGPDGLRHRLEATGMLTRLLTPWDVARAVETPPASTRARLRGDFVRAARAAGVEYSVDWVRLKVGEGRAVSLPDPLDNANSAAEDLIAALGDLGGGESAGAAPTEFDRILARAASGQQR